MRVHQDKFLHGTRDCHKAAASLLLHRARVASLFRSDRSVIGENPFLKPDQYHDRILRSLCSMDGDELHPFRVLFLIRGGGPAHMTQDIYGKKFFPTPLNQSLGSDSSKLASAFSQVLLSPA